MYDFIHVEPRIRHAIVRMADELFPDMAFFKAVERIVPLLEYIDLDDDNDNYMDRKTIEKAYFAKMFSNFVFEDIDDDYLHELCMRVIPPGNMQLMMPLHNWLHTHSLGLYFVLNHCTPPPATTKTRRNVHYRKLVEISSQWADFESAKMTKNVRILAKWHMAVLPTPFWFHEIKTNFLYIKHQRLIIVTDPRGFDVLLGYNPT